MATYQEYIAYAASKGFQPLTETAFQALVLAGFNPITKQWEPRVERAA